MKYGIGLDMGIASIGWAVIELDEMETPIRIANLGVRIFDKAEHPKTGASLALPRRSARSMRRRLRRHRHRLERIKILLEEQGVITQQELADIYVSKEQLTDIYELRANGLDKKLIPSDWARVLVHIAQRRGFKSNRKADSKDKEAGKLLTAIKENLELQQEKNYRTVGEMFYKDEKFADKKRNKSENYGHTINRAQLVEEIEMLFTAQRQLGNAFAGEELKDKYLVIFSSQRSFEMGPGGNSPYAGDQIEKMVGMCTFEREEKRIAKACYTFEYFNLLSKINNIKIKGKTSTRQLNESELAQIVQLAKTKQKLTYADIRNTLDIDEDEVFNDVSYKKSEDKKIQESKIKFEYLNAYHEMRKALDNIRKGYIKDEIDSDKLDKIGEIFTKYKNDDGIKIKLTEAGCSQEEIICLVDNMGSFSNFGSLSAKAIKKILPYLEVGLKYNEACERAGYNFRAYGQQEKKKFLPATAEELDDITSPVVRRAVSQTIKLVNSLIRQYDSPSYLNIELAREMSKNFEDRKALEKEMSENSKKNENVKNRIQQEYRKVNPTGQDIVKFKLWEEQCGRCAYSGESISITTLFTEAYEVDHIVPYSISFNDGFVNKVLVLARENQQKGNRLPLEYFKDIGRDPSDFETWVNTQIKNPRKRDALLKEYLTDDELTGFKDRNLNDTRYMSSFMYNYINEYLQFAENNVGRKKNVKAVNGAITSYLRKRWGLSKLREDGDLHHALDAVTIACTTDGMIQQISRHVKFMEIKYWRQQDGFVDKRTGEILSKAELNEQLDKKFPMPWPHFRKELEARLSNNPEFYIRKLNLPYPVEEIKPIFVSRMPRRKVGGAAHKDTVRSNKCETEGILITKTALTELKLDKKTGEIEGYFYPGSDRLLYEALKKRLQEFSGNAKEAFENYEFHKPTSDGQLGPIVKKVKIESTSTLNVKLHNGQGSAANESMVRVDVFHVDQEGYYLVPIYVSDTVKDSLPNKAIVAYKPYDEWKEMNEEAFIFSLYANDLICIEHKNGFKFSNVNSAGSSLPKAISVDGEVFAYYTGTGISVGAISVVTHDSTYKISNLGVKTLKKITKCIVDNLGNINKVQKETRQDFSNRKKDPNYKG